MWFLNKVLDQTVRLKIIVTDPRDVLSSATPSLVNSAEQHEALARSVFLKRVPFYPKSQLNYTFIAENKTAFFCIYRHNFC